MLGLMPNQPLLISSLIDFAEHHHGDTEIVSSRVEGDLHRYTCSVARRARQVANALDGMNLLFSDRVATLAWNGYRHLELLLGMAAGPRPAHDQPAPAPGADHLDRQPRRRPVLCFDMTFLPLVQAIHARSPTIRQRTPSRRLRRRRRPANRRQNASRHGSLTVAYSRCAFARKFERRSAGI